MILWCFWTEKEIVKCWDHLLTEGQEGFALNINSCESDNGTLKNTDVYVLKTCFFSSSSNLLYFDTVLLLEIYYMVYEFVY